MKNHISKVVIVLLLCLLIFSVYLYKRNATPKVEKEVSKEVASEAKKEVSNEISIAEKLMLAYPDFLIEQTDSSIIWKDGYEMILDDGIQNKSFDSLLAAPDIEDQFIFKYPKGKMLDEPAKNADPGRIRYQPFFKRMYGETEREAEQNLTIIHWLPNSYNKRIRISKVNGIHEKLIAISNELDKEPDLAKYLVNIGGTFNWRKINGVDKLSAHSFGIAIDISTKFSDYWKWNIEYLDNTQQIGYKNQIPFKIVEIFEKHGFIWGGKWYHYDTMHFEYRPELLIE